MPVRLTNRVRNGGIDTRGLRTTAQTLLDSLGHGRSTLSLSLVRDPAIRALNRQYRGKDRATDVLSFPLLEPAELAGGTEPKLLGDVVISVDTAVRQAADYDAPLRRELERLLIHGILHLLGHDHAAAAERRRMEKEERRLAERIGMPWPY